MGDYGHDLQFGCFLTPRADRPEGVLDLATLADETGLDLLSVQDHPYQPRFLDAWTLLSVLAARTARIRVFPNVANLPLRPPAVLARSVASLDILSGGRVELGLGSGAIWDGIAAMGVSRLSPAESVDALEEAIGVLRSLWHPGDPVHVHGKHYRLDGASPGPVPVHEVGIWIGAYKPRMLRLTGRLADGWIPSLGYAGPDELPAMNATIDDAARRVGRDPRAIRRIYNVQGTFDRERSGFLHGPPEGWAEQLARLALDAGVSGFILAPGRDAVSDLRRFAEEVAPATRELVAAERAAQAGSTATGPLSAADAADRIGVAPPPVAATLQPNADAGVTGPRRTGTDLLDEPARPSAPARPQAPVSAAGRTGQQALVAVHDHLRGELEQIRDAVREVAAGRRDPASARSLINRMTMRQNYWSVGAFCAAYCRVVSIHHTIEDERVFVDLVSGEPELEPVISTLTAEHHVIADVLVDLDTSLVEMVDDPATIADVAHQVDVLTDVLLSHLSYEERELLPAIGRQGLGI